MTSDGPFAQLPPDIAYGSRDCAHCHRSGSTLFCTKCCVEDIGSIATHYCCKECHTAHWDQHKKACRPRRRLINAVRIMSSLWQAYAVATYTKTTQYAGHSSGIINAVDTKYPWPSPRMLTGEQTIFRNFPRDVMPENVPEEVKQALLYEHSCRDVVICGRNLIELLIRPISSSLAEAEFIPRHQVWKTWAAGDPHQTTHTILRVGLESGENFAVDLTGKQYGWKETLYTFDIYATQRGSHLFSRRLGVAALEAAQSMSTQPREELVRAAYSIRRDVADTMATYVEEAIRASDLAVRGLLSEKNDSFLDLFVTLVDDVRARLVAHIRDLTDRRGIGRIYPTNELEYRGYGGIKVVQDEETAQQLTDMWFTHQQAHAFGYSPFHLGSMWTIKFQNLEKSRMEK